MLGLGEYLVSFAVMILGPATKVVAQGSRTPSGVDAEAGILLEHGEGRRSVRVATLMNATPGEAKIFGSTGYLDILPRFHHPDSMIFNRAGKAPETVTLRPLGQGFAHELIEVCEGIRERRTDSAFLPMSM